MPSHSIYRVPPVASAEVSRQTRGQQGCFVVEGSLLGLDPSGEFRNIAALVAGTRAVAAQPARAPQLQRVLGDTSEGQLIRDVDEGSLAHRPRTAEHIHQLVHALNGAMLPQLTSGPGFSLVPVPEALWHRLQAHYEQHKLAGSVDETTNGDGMKGKPALIAPLVDVADGGSLLRAVQATLQPILEGWAGRALVLQRCHGMRVYREGGALDRHVDWPLSHVVAIILNVAQEGMRSSWPLVIEDHQGREHTLEMSPGEMLLYESARLVHGRPTPLNGTSYVNLFVHFKPKDGWDAASMAQPRWRV
jgi:hypothetical protein